MLRSRSLAERIAAVGAASPKPQASLLLSPAPRGAFLRRRSAFGGRHSGYCPSRRSLLKANRRVDAEAKSRNLAFIATLMDSGVEFIAVDNPHANKLTIGSRC
jgi:hypothetical protein